MCGINGAISLNKQKPVNWESDMRPSIAIMNNTIAHRGPDSDGIYIKDLIALGFRRLSIIDLAHSANQPMFSNDKNVVIVFNGEIYNYLELREKLVQKGYQFRTSSDTEVIINSYLEYGKDCVQHFNGMWAFAIYDFRSNKLFCSRDRMGVKPFYYYITDDKLFFSSELKAIHKATGINKANHTRVYQYLAYGYRLNNGETFFKDCHELLPGTNLIIENDEVKLETYWSLKNDLFEHQKDLDYKKEFTELFKSAVKLRYRSDVPVALLLSGGLDSSAIARVTDNLITSGELGQNEIHAFIAAFPNFKDDETEIAREFVKTCDHIKLHEIQVDSSHAIESLEQLSYDFDHPMLSFNTVVHNQIMKACKEQGIKVVINGQGSDEALAGYDKTICGAFLLDQLISRKGNFLKEFKSLNKENGYSKKYLLTQMGKSLLNPPFASYLRAKYQEKMIPCLNKDFVKNNNGYRSLYKFSPAGGNLNNYLLDAIKNQDINAILHYEDISSMNQSIEIRSPFLDYRMMEFAFSIPDSLKLKEGVSKPILRETIGKELPDSITKNRRKIGFNTPFTDYITNDPVFKNYVIGILESESFKNRNIWDAEKMKEAFKNPSDNPKFPYWRVLNLELWSRVYNIDNL